MSISISAANKLLDALSITPYDLLEHLDEIARVRGALVVEGDLDGSEARLNMAGKPAIITVARRVTDIPRRRFSTAHELGHLEMHRWKVTLCTSTDMMEWNVKEGSQNLELEANEFAAALLMPERFFGSLCEEEPSIDYFIELADQFRVSLTAAAIRYTNFTPEPVAIVLSQDGFIKWFRASREFEEMKLFVDVRSRVYPGSRARLFFEGKTMPTTPKRIAADAWLRPGNYNRDATYS
ncbi:MAG: ImmA/IrrE family metallo-endopeptidase [Anaerolineae bacterium]|nr:MAG: ImmA/IrrE family metallo-endopeptidase [Anaerolineae bacterium]